MSIVLTPITADPDYSGETDVTAIRLAMGTKAADVASNGDGGSTPDLDAYAQAIADGTSELNELAAGGSIAVPITTTAGSVAAGTVARDARVLAMWWLHNKFPAKGETENSYDRPRKTVIERWERWRYVAFADLPPGFTEATAGGFLTTNVTGGSYATVNQDGQEITPPPLKVGPYYDPNRRWYRPGQLG